MRSVPNLCPTALRAAALIRCDDGHLPRHDGLIGPLPALALSGSTEGVGPIRIPAQPATPGVTAHAGRAVWQRVTDWTIQSAKASLLRHSVTG